MSQLRDSIVSKRNLAHLARKSGLYTLTIPSQKMHSIDSTSALFKAFLGFIYTVTDLSACRLALATLLYFNDKQNICLPDVMQEPDQLPCQMHHLSTLRDVDAEARRVSTVGGIDHSLFDREHHEALLEFENLTGIRFAQFGLLKQAFTHRSSAARAMEHATTSKQAVRDDLRSKQGSQCQTCSREGNFCHQQAWALRHNQRLEWLGDACLHFITSDFIFFNRPQLDSASMSRLGQAFLNNTILSNAAISLRMHLCLKCDLKDEQKFGRAHRKALADSFEAFTGALFLDREPHSISALRCFAWTVLFEYITPHLAGDDPKSLLKRAIKEFNNDKMEMTSSVGRCHDTKSTLNIECLKNRAELQYETIQVSGPNHEPMYTVAVLINGVRFTVARGFSLMDAQQGAANLANFKLGVNGFKNCRRIKRMRHTV